MVEVTGQQEKSAEVTELWKEIEAKVDALITQRINLFHDALVKRKQIPPMPAAENPEEHQSLQGGL